MPILLRVAGFIGSSCRFFREYAEKPKSQALPALSEFASDSGGCNAYSSAAGIAMYLEKAYGGTLPMAVHALLMYYSMAIAQGI